MKSPHRNTASCGSFVLAMVLALWPAGVGATQKPLSAAERKQIHDRLFSGMHGDIDRQLAGTKGDVVLEPYPTHRPEGALRSLKEVVDLYTCNAHAILVGFPTSSRSEEASSGTTIYTTWTIRAEDVLKIPYGRQLPQRSTVEALSNGGTVTRMDGRKITVPSLELPEGLHGTHRYLLFLRLVPETGSFRLNAAFGIDGELALSHPKGTYPNVEKARSEDLVTATRDAVPEALAWEGCVKGPR